uniref:Uncharacterized protein n=1 Tax=Periphykon beckeri TaxID=2006982 RepID=A0A1Z1M2M4_9FLOR|nr:hypothetical protein [Periphykon beckeri]ARW60308.1 hypothetical protein [Periphykon beckeri]
MNNFLFFRLYLCIVLVLLLIFSFFISKQLLYIYISYCNYVFLFKHVKKKLCLDENTYSNFLNFYLFRRTLFSSISMCEFILELKSNLYQKQLCYYSLAYLYYKNSFYSIAEYYYLKIFSSSTSNDQAVLNLLNMYSKLGYKTRVDKLL